MVRTTLLLLITFFTAEVSANSVKLDIPPMIPDYQLIIGISGGGGWFKGDKRIANKRYTYNASSYAIGGCNASLYTGDFFMQSRFESGGWEGSKINELYIAGGLNSTGSNWRWFGSLGVGYKVFLVTTDGPDSDYWGNDRDTFCDASVGGIFRPSGSFLLRSGIGYQLVPGTASYGFLISFAENHIKLWDNIGFYALIHNKHILNRDRTSPVRHQIGIKAGIDFYITPKIEEVL
jgi:hypothetical protein